MVLTKAISKEDYNKLVMVEVLRAKVTKSISVEWDEVNPSTTKVFDDEGEPIGKIMRLTLHFDGSLSSVWATLVFNLYAAFDEVNNEIDYPLSETIVEIPIVSMIKPKEDSNA